MMLSEEEKEDRQRAWLEYLDRQGMGPRHRKTKENGSRTGELSMSKRTWRPCRVCGSGHSNPMSSSLCPTCGVTEAAANEEAARHREEEENETYLDEIADLIVASIREDAEGPFVRGDGNGWVTVNGSFNMRVAVKAAFEQLHKKKGE